jgi:hypothetical protein
MKIERMVGRGKWAWKGLLAAAVVSMLGVPAHAASLSVYLSPPGAMSSVLPGVLTEDFNNSALLNPVAGASYGSPIGTYSVPAGKKMAVIAADDYGGANNSQYMYVGNRRTGDALVVTLDLSTPRNYFGFWWSAGDASNRLSLYSGGLLIATFQTSDITTMLATSPIYALDGVTSYLSSQYKGNPNTGPYSGHASGESFAYVNLVATGFAFDKIVFDNNGTSGFENDNHSVLTGNVDIPRDFPSFVKVVDVPFINNPVPEPGTGALAGAALMGGLVALRKLRRRPAGKQ